MDRFVPQGFGGDDISDKTLCALCSNQADPDYYCKTCNAELCYQHKGDWHKCPITRDVINHPPHYTFGKFEVIDVLEDWFPTDPLLWQVGKYISRAGRKGSRAEDLKKARFYLDRAILQAEKGEDL